MDKIVVTGGRRLTGDVRAGGAKNSALPLMFACLLTDEPCRLSGVPDVADIRTAVRLLEKLGARVESPAAGEFLIDCSAVDQWEAPYELVRTMRASFLVLGPLLARFGRARVSAPGGCAIGSRPVDMHIAAISRLGAEIVQDHGYVEALSDGLRGGHVILPMPSVGATENALMAASLAAGATRIENAAREPEIVDLAEALAGMGAQISGAGSSLIEIEGVGRLTGMNREVVADRIVAGTYLIAGAISGGDVLVEGARSEHLGSLLEALEAAGCRLSEEKGAVRLAMDGPPRAVSVATAPYPGFPTDLQAQFMALMCLADGTSNIDERIFENRFMHVQELVRMGASIRSAGRRAIVTGQRALSGAPVMATDLRASVCLLLAGLAAEGTTEVLRVYHLDRGYEHIEAKLAALGADVRREKM